MKPEELLHLFGPYLPTDRFRALLRGRELPAVQHGAAMMVDISGFTPLTTRLVAEYGAERAGEELKRRINPMFEAVAGLVFTHGGSVTRFLGDGFTAWFDDQPAERDLPNIPGVLRALVAGTEMQGVMRIFRGLRLKVLIGTGAANRWVVGLPEHGLNDLLSGAAVESMVSLAGEAQPDQVLVHRDAVPLLRREGVMFEVDPSTGTAVIASVPEAIIDTSRKHRWALWRAEGDPNAVLDAVRPFVSSTIRHQVESGFGDFVGELRYAMPMFVQFGGAATDRGMVDHIVCEVQTILAETGGRLMSVEVSDKGNVLFAVFGAPITYGDDAQRALHAAFAVREIANELNTPDAIRVGISRGLLYAGTVGGEVRHEYSTIGDETNIAARLMTYATPGQILVSSAVRKEVGSRVVFRELPPIMVKGRSDPIPVTEPLSEQRGESGRKHTGKFVGRREELAQLEKLIRAVIIGHTRIVRIEGQAGIGKSRLTGEMTRIAVNAGMRAAGGDCISTGRQTVYLPWRELLYSLFEFNGTDDITRLTAFIESVEPTWLPRLPLLGDVLQLPIPNTPQTAPLEGRMRRQAIFALIMDILTTLANKQPLLLIVEDIQWIDEVSEVLLIELARRLQFEPAPIFLILIHRSQSETELSTELIRTVSEMHFHTHMLLDELSRMDLNAMLENALNMSPPPELLRFVAERTQGNPFFVLEVLDTLIETGYIQTTGSRVRILRDLREADMPRTVQGLIQARIDRLPELDKLVLKVAAVIGRQFQVRVLADSLPIDMEFPELLTRLRVLEERDFSLPDESEAELTYLFRHAITQEVTYQSLPFAQRRVLHQAVADTLRQIAPDAVERLAYHYMHSGDEESARKYTTLAGQKAFREYANAAALEYFKQALELVRTDTERFDVLRQMLSVMLRLGDMPGVSQHLGELKEVVKRSNGRPDWYARVALIEGNYYTQTSAWQEAADCARIAIEMAEEAQSDALSWDAYILLRSALVSMNQMREVERLDLDRKMQITAERLGGQRYAIELILTWFEDMYAESPEIAIQGAQTALGRAEELQDPILIAKCLDILADFYTRENDLVAAMDTSRQQITLLRQIGSRSREAQTMVRIGVLLVHLGQLSEGNAHLIDAYRMLRQIGERAGEADSLVWLGVIAEHYKAYDEALAYHKRGLILQEQIDSRADIALTLFHMGNAYIRKGDYADAARVLNDARTLLSDVDEIGVAQAEIDLYNGDTGSAHRRVQPMFSRLQRRQLKDIIMPGLAYWRVIKVLEAVGQYEQAAQLRRAFREIVKGVLGKLVDSQWRTAYVQNIWYHAELMAD
jgi:predicted ATPase/class 3 adenylate cyclase